MFSPVGKMNFLNGNFRNFLLKSARTFCSEATQVANVTEGSTSVILPPKAPLVNIGDRKFPFMNNLDKPKQVWVENFDAVQENKLGIIELHPEVFGVMPRIDLIHDNIKWQRNYRRVSFANTKVRAEVRGGGRKPWPQKGQGRSRHGSIRSPLFRGGGVVHGPRSPTSYFYMLPFYQRVLGLTSTLSVKLAQDDLHVVPNLEIPSDDPQYLDDMIEARNWGVSVLLIDDTDIMPRNITVATEGVKHVNLMPVYGLNVYSMLKHETLVLTLSAVERLEERLLYQLNRVDATEKGRKFKPNQV